MTSSGVRLADLLTAMSLATDLGLGQPQEHMLRAASLSMRIGQRLGLGPSDLCTLYDVSVLTYVGCPVFGDEGSRMFGDDIAFRAGAADVDLAGFPALVFMLRRAGQGTGALNRARQSAALAARGGRQMLEQMANHCSAAGDFATRLGLDAEVRLGIEQSYARWDGRGVPSRLAGQEVSLAARISHLAEAAEVLHRAGGTPAAMDVIRSRSGTDFDPQLVAVLQRQPEELMHGLDTVGATEVVDLEPVPRPPLTEDELDAALEAIGDFCDLRCSWFAGHAAGTARLVADAAGLLGFGDEEIRLSRRAALVHDVGRFGVPGSVWSSPGPLREGDRERMRLHTYYVERIFARPEPLRRIGLLASTHHERLDGSGYHRGLAGAMLSRPARLLAAADSYHAMLQARPHRPARTPQDAARELRGQVSVGHLDPEVVEAVLSAAGHATRTEQPPSRLPAGLTAREVDVVRLLAQGLTNKEIARQLGITPKTVSNHLEHSYLKLGVVNRAGATFAAMTLGLLA